MLFVLWSLPLALVPELGLLILPQEILRIETVVKRFELIPMTDIASPLIWLVVDVAVS
jgi:hypothetical protein